MWEDVNFTRRALCKVLVRDWLYTYDPSSPEGERYRRYVQRPDLARAAALGRAAMAAGADSDQICEGHIPLSLAYDLRHIGRKEKEAYYARLLRQAEGIPEATAK